MFKIAILADGGPGAGMGHIMRCIALADELKLYDCHVCFICTELNCTRDCANVIKACGHIAVNLTNHPSATGAIRSRESPYPEQELINSHGCSIQTEKEILRNYFKTHAYDLLLVDSYKVTFDFLAAMKSVAGKLGYIDDLNAFTYPADILVNGNVYASKLRYRKYSPDEIILAGAEYNLIRREFANLRRKKTAGIVQSILVTSGGTDEHEMCHRIAEIILADKELASLRLNIVVGPCFAGTAKLHELALRQPSVILCRNPARISEIMLNSDMAISAAGSTLYELCACGVPSLSFIAAENQALLADYMDELGLIRCLGRYNEISPETLCSSVKALAPDKNERAHISSSMRRLIDGRGAERTAAAILKMLLK